MVLSKYSVIMGQRENKSDDNGDHIVEDSALLVHGSSASSPGLVYRS